MTKATADLLIIGGGIQGCATALFAAQKGMSVILVEKDTIARHASGVNAGGVRRLGRDLREIALSCFSMKLWNRLSDILDDECGFQPAPQIKVALSDGDMAILQKRADDVAALGYSHEQMISESETKSYLPAVTQDCIGGLMSMDGYAQPFWTTMAFANKARKLGVRLFENERVERIHKQQDLWEISTPVGTYCAPILLNCAGAWAGKLAAQIGDFAPIEAVAPLMIVTQPLSPFCSAVVGTASRPLSFKQMANGTVIIGGARRGRANIDDNRTDIDFHQLQKTASTAKDVFPIMRKAIVQRAWSGIEGYTPDNVPVIGRSSQHDNAFHAFGFSAHGFQLGPGVGMLMADFIESGIRPAEFEPFSIDRFARETSDQV